MTADLIQICQQCRSETAKSIDNYIEALEAMRAELTEIKNKPAPEQSEAVETLITLIAPSIERWEKLQDMGSRIGDDMALIVATYRIVRPRKK